MLTSPNVQIGPDNHWRNVGVQQGHKYYLRQFGKLKVENYQHNPFLQISCRSWGHKWSSLLQLKPTLTQPNLTRVSGATFSMP